MELTRSLEDYLETILTLEAEHKAARAKDIAERMEVKRGTVTGALKSLAEKGLIHYEPYRAITLTPRGARIAREVRRRHGVIKAFLQRVLLLDDPVAEDNACRMEHAMDRAAVDRLVQFIDYIHQCPRTGEDWIQAFVNFFSRDTPKTDQCKACLEACVERYRERP